MNRRDALKVSAAAAAVPVIVPAAQVRKARAPWKPAVFNASQNETVIAVSDRIIPATDTPGAKEALVNQYIDLFLAEGPEQERQRFLDGLRWLEEYSVKDQGKPFSKLSTVQQDAILSKLDAGENSPTLAEGHRFFRMAKVMTARVYYQTEIGYRELNKGGVPKTFGCSHSARHPG